MDNSKYENPSSELIMNSIMFSIVVHLRRMELIVEVQTQTEIVLKDHGKSFIISIVEKKDA